MGQVRHFTTWIAALWHEIVRITGCVENHNGDPVAAAWVVAIGADYIGSSVVTTDTNGQFAIHAGADSEIVLLAHAGTRNSYSEQRQLSTGSAPLGLNQCFVVSDEVNDALARTLRVQLAATLAQLEETEAALAALRTDYEAALAGLADAAAHGAALEAALAETEAALAACMAARADPPSHPDLRRELESCQAELLNAQTALAVAQAERDAARANLAVAQAELETTREALAIAKVELATCDAALTATQAELASCHSGWAASQAAAAAAAEVCNILLAECQAELNTVRQ